MFSPRPVALALCLVAAAIAAMPANAMEDLSPALPEETMLYARCAGMQALLDELAASPLVTDGKLLPGLYLGQLRELLPFLAGETDVPAETWEKALFSIQTVHCAIAGFDSATETLDMLLAIEIGDVDLVRGIVEQLTGKEAFFAGEVAGARVMGFAGPDDTDWYYAFQKGMLLGATTPERITSVLEGRVTPARRNLATRAEYRSGVLPAGRGVTLWAWADLKSYFAGVNDYFGMLGPRDSEFLKVLDILEFDQLHSLCAASGAGATRIRVTHEAEQSWLKAISGVAGPSSLSAWVPPGSLFMGADCGSIDKKYKALKRLILEEDRFKVGEEFKKGIAEAEQQLGVGFDKLAKTLGNEWAIFLPILPEQGRVDEDCLTFAFAIRDREAFDLLVTSVLESPLVRQLAEHDQPLVRTMIEDAEIFHSGRKDRTDGPCFAVDGNVLLLSGDRLALEAALNAKASGANLLTARGVNMGSLPTAAGKHFALLMEPMLMEERDFTPLLDLIRPGALLAATIDETPGSLSITVNHPTASFISFLLGGEVLSEAYGEQRNACLSNLRAIGDAVNACRKQRGEDPRSLQALVPDFLEAHRLVCPLDRKEEGEEGTSCSYEHLLHTEREGDWTIMAYCPHRLHRRLVLYNGGNASTARESSFIRQLKRQE